MQPSSPFAPGPLNPLSIRSRIIRSNPMEKPHAGTSLPVNFPIILSYLPPPPHSAKLIHGDLKNRSGIVGHTAHQRGVKEHAEICCLYRIHIGDAVSRSSQTVADFQIQGSLSFKNATPSATSLVISLLKVKQISFVNDSFA